MKVLICQICRALSGSEKYIIELLPLLKERGIEPVFLAVSLKKDDDNYQEIIKPIEDQGVKVYHIATQYPLSFTLIKQIHRIIQKEGYPLVNPHLIHADFWMALVKTFFYQKLKIVSLKHGFGDAFTQEFGHDSAKKKYNLYYFVARYAETKINHSIAVSNGVANLHIAQGISKKDEISVVYTGLNTQAFNKREGEHYRVSKQQLVVIGRLIPLKNHKVLFEAMPKVMEAFPDCQLLVLGDGPERQNLEKLITDLSLENNVVLLGHRTDALAYVEASDAMIIPSKSEGFPLVVLEAFGLKTPVIGFDVPSINEMIVDGESGYLIKPFNADLLADKIIELLQNKEQAAGFAEAAYDRLQSHFDRKVMGDKIVEQFLRIGHL